MSETRIKIKELEMNGETAIRIAKCLKKHEPEIWKVLSGELKQAISIHDVVGQSELLVCGNCLNNHTNKEYEGYCSQSCFDGIK